MFAGLTAPVLAAEPFPEDQLRAGQLAPDPGAAQLFDRLPKETVRHVPVAEHGSRARRDAPAEEILGAGLGGIARA